MESNLMTAKPYDDRVAQPIYFYPFLSPLSNKPTPEALNAHRARLRQAVVAPRPTLIYIHIPYCQSLCFFCGFYREKVPADGQVLTRYVRRVQEEMRFYGQSQYVRGLDIQAVYFGGGTPTVLPPDLIADLLESLHDNFTIRDGTELSYEGEVRTLRDPQRLSVLRQYGCTRISFGVQSFDAKVRKLSGVRATETDVMTCIEHVMAAGYRVNLDLMYGLPGQTFEIWKKDLARAVSLGAANIDVYDTVLYPHAQLFGMRKKLKHELPDEALRLEMLDYGLAYLAENGYAHETIEDLTRPGFGYRMKRLVYGGGDGRSQMIGMGASSIGFLAGSAYRNLIPGDYEQCTGEDFPPVGLLMPVGPQDELKRALVFFPKLLRLNEEDLDPGMLEPYLPILASMVCRGLIEPDPGGYRLTPLGRLWTDNMGFEFIEPREQQRIWKLGY